VCDPGLGDEDAVHIDEVALPEQFLPRVFLNVFFKNFLLQFELVAVHEKDLVLEQGGEVVHDVVVVQENLVVGQHVDDLSEFLVEDEGLPLVGRLHVVQHVLLRVVDLHLVEKVGQNLLQDLEQLVYYLPLLDLHVLETVLRAAVQFGHDKIVGVGFKRVAVELLDFLVDLIDDLQTVLVHVLQFLLDEGIGRGLCEGEGGFFIEEFKSAVEGFQVKVVVGEVDHHLLQETVVVLFAVLPD
jgi:hypothetical protein